MFNFGSLFKQKEAVLYNGKKVKEGTKISWVNSDGYKLEGIIERRQYDCELALPAGHEPRFQEPHIQRTLKKGTLFFWNPQFLITDYVTADV